MSLEKSKPSIIVVDSYKEGQRIDNFLITQLKGLPKSHVYRILRKGEVRVNKKRVKPDYRLQKEDAVRIPPLQLAAKARHPELPSKNLQQLLENNILYEDKSLLVINKPSGIAVHGGSGISLGLIEALRAMRPKDRYIELVHRLDRETSGCIMLAKKPSMLKELHELLRQGQVEKRYLALVRGQWPKHLYKVDIGLEKNELRSGERVVNATVDGKPSVTEFRVIQRFTDATLMEAKPLTGRTHQIRVHAAYAEHPIIGDEKYGDKNTNKRFRNQGCNRLFLHAAALSFRLASSGQTVSLAAELDKGLKQFLQALSGMAQKEAGENNSSLTLIGEA
jgi:23S rRNA pseudouridine955/2504/2580 synthase